MEQTLIDQIINYCIGLTALQQRENRDLLLRGLPSKPVAALARSRLARSVVSANQAVTGLVWERS